MICDECKTVAHCLKNGQQEPVAWGYPVPEGGIIGSITPEEHAHHEGEYTVPLYTSPQPAQRKPLGFAGIMIWGGDVTVTKVFTEVEITRSREPSELIKLVVKECLDELAAHGIKGDA